MTTQLDTLRKMDRDLAQLECEVGVGDLDYVEGLQYKLLASITLLLVIQIRESPSGTGLPTPPERKMIALISSGLAKIKVDIDAKNLEIATNHIAELQVSLHALIEVEVQGAECMQGGTHPIQPVVMLDKVARFKENKIVRKLLDHCREHGLDLNDLHTMNFSTEDHVQLAQLSGYSVCGAADLSYFPRDIIRKADKVVDKLVAESKVSSDSEEET